MTLFLRLFLIFSLKNFAIGSLFRRHETPYFLEYDKGSALLDSIGYGDMNYFHDAQVQQNETTMARLPEDTFPLSYFLQITAPDVQSEQTTFAGEVTIKIWVQKSTNKIVLNAAFLEIVKIRITRSQPGMVLPCTYRLVPENDTLIVTTEYDYLMADYPYEIYINYTGTINNYPRGFYKRCYPKGNVTKCFVATQFEAIRGRQVFPCFDEPAKKATFTISIAAFSNQTVLSNMPLQNKSEPDPTIGNRVRYNFFPSYLMSTYLVAFFISDDFASLSTTKGNFSVWSRKSMIENGHYALTEGQKLYRVLTDDTGVNLNLLKMDMVALPTFRGGMENWGLITFRESLLLYNKKESTSKMQYVTAIMAHEISHHWFGNLVTMKWWDDLWIKEGLATYFQYFAPHRAEPTWKMDQFFVMHALHVALSVDGVRMCRAMSSPVNTKTDLQRKYDQISYEKGGSVIRMMSHMVTQRIFKLALNYFIKRASYFGGVATRHLLWDAVEKTMMEQGKTLGPNVNFTRMMEQWTTTCGYPVITVTRRLNGTRADIELSQMTYKSPISKHETPDTEWTVGITYTKQSSLDFKNTEPTLWSFGEQNITLKNEVAKDEWFLCNNQQSGYFRVEYDDWGYKLITKQMHENPSVIHTLNKMQIIDDIFEFVNRGKKKFELLFELLGKYMNKEEDEMPLLIAVRKLYQLERQYAATSVAQPLKDYIKNCLKNIYKRIQFHPKSDDPLPSRIFRSEIVKVACRYGYADCLKKAEEEYNNSKTLTEVNADLKFTVMCTMLGSKISGEIFDKIWYLIKASNGSEERDLAYNTPSCVNCKHLLKKYWYKTLEDREIDLYRIISSMTNTARGVTAVLECIGEIMPNSSKYERGKEMLSFSIEAVKWTGASQEHVKLLDTLITNATKLNDTWTTKALKEAKQQVTETKRLNDERAIEIAKGLGISVTTEAPTTPRPSAATTMTPTMLIYIFVSIASLKINNIFKFSIL